MLGWRLSHIYGVTEACQTHLCTYGAAVMTKIDVIIINEILSLLFLEEHEGLNLASISHTYLKFRVLEAEWEFPFTMVLN